MEQVDKIEYMAINGMGRGKDAFLLVRAFGQVHTFSHFLLLIDFPMASSTATLSISCWFEKR